jgi:hypothetical protein
MSDSPPLTPYNNPTRPLEASLKQATGADMDSTLVTKLKVHAVMTANHVNPKLYLNSRKRRFLRSSCLIAASGL